MHGFSDEVSHLHMVEVGVGGERVHLLLGHIIREFVVPDLISSAQELFPAGVLIAVHWAAYLLSAESHGYIHELIGLPGSQAPGIKFFAFI